MAANQGAGRDAGRDTTAGIGAGTVATYSNAGQQWDFYEIDPAIVRIARDGR